MTRIRIDKNWEEKEWLKNKNHANRKKKDECIKVDHMQNWDGIGNNELNFCENSVMSIKNGIKFEVIQ